MACALMLGTLTLGLAPGDARAADLVRVETVGGQVLQGRLVGSTPRDLTIDIPGGRGLVTIARGEVRRYNVVAVDRAAVQRPARLPVTERAGSLRLSGANSMGAKLLPALLADYGLEAGMTGVQEEIATDPEARVLQIQGAESTRRFQAQILSHGSSSAFADLASGQADIGMSTRRATEAEARALQIAPQAGPQRAENEFVIGLSGVAIIVHRDNPIRSLPVAKLRDFLSGATTRWPIDGGNGLPVTVYALDARSGEYSAVQDRILGPGVRLSPHAKLFESNEDLADAVAADPAGIGLVGVAYARNARALRLDQDCGLGGAPTDFSLKTEEYPLSRRLYLYTTGRSTPLARDMVSYAESVRAQAVVASAGFINLDPMLASAEESSAQIAAVGAFLPEELRGPASPQMQLLRQTLAGARRLSVTFRFEAGRADLDPRAEADLDRLAQWKRRDGNANASIVLIGHASVDGQLAVNVDLSRARAQAVSMRLQQMGVGVARVEGVGPVNQVVCNRSAAETDMNRRVEVWVR